MNKLLEHDRSTMSPEELQQSLERDKIAKKVMRTRFLQHFLKICSPSMILRSIANRSATPPI